MTATARPPEESGLLLPIMEGLARVCSFLATVLLARRLGPAAVGVVAFSTAVLLYVGRVVDAGIDLGIGPREASIDRPDLAGFIRGVLGGRLVLALASIPLLVLGAQFLDAPTRWVLSLYALTLVPAALGTRWVLIGSGRLLRSGATRVAGESLNLLIIAVALFGWRSERALLVVPLAQLAGDTLATALQWRQTRRLGLRPGVAWSIATIRELIPRVTPYVASTLLGLAIFNADVLFLQWFKGQETVGLYAAAYLGVSFLLNLMAAYTLTLIAQLASAVTDEERSQRFHHAGRQVVSLAVPILVAGAALGPWATTLILGPAFAPASDVLPLLLVSVMFSVLREVYVGGTIATAGERGLLVSVAWAAAANVALNLVLVPAYGMLGAAAATALAEALRLAVAAQVAHRRGLPRLEGWILLACAPVVFALLVSPLGPTPLPWPWAVGGALVGLAVAWKAAGIPFTRRWAARQLNDQAPAAARAVRP